MEQNLSENTENQVVTNEQPEYTPPKLTVADTSKAEFWDDVIDEDQQQTPQTNVDTNQTNQESQTQDDSLNDDSDLHYTGNNQYISALEQWARQNGYSSEEFDVTQLDDSFDEEQMNYVVGRLQAMKHIDTLDPKLHKLIENNINIDQYVQERLQYESLMNLPDENLFKGQLYNHLVNQHHQMGTLQLDKENNITEDSQNMILEEVEKYYSRLSPEQVTNKVNEIRQSLTQSIDQIPNSLQQRSEQDYQNQLESFNEERESYIKHVNEQIDKSKNIVVNFSGQSEKDEFKNYVNEMTSLTEIENEGSKENVIPLFHQLQNDSDLLVEVLRMMHLKQNGYFTDHKMSARKDAYNLLGLSPQVTQKNSKGSRQGTYKGLNIANTSNKEFWD
tara:strand:+ start:1967 stop:3133 length:1167 start_codon:yes stop_codon:yes gene_type:complete